MQMRVGKGGDVSEMPKMGLERAAGERKSKEVDVHDGLNTSEVSSGAASSQLVYLLACFAVSKKKELKKKNLDWFSSSPYLSPLLS